MLFNMIISITQISAHISHSPIWWIVSKMQCKALWKSPVHEEFRLYLLDRLLRKKPTKPQNQRALYFMTIKRHHNLRGTCGQSFGCLKSQFRSKVSCMAVSIPKIIGEALPYINCISWVLWRPNCFRGSCAASSEPAKCKVIKLQCQHRLGLFTWWSITLSYLVAILVSSTYSTCAFNCRCNNSTDYSPSEGSTHSLKFPVSLKVLQ